MEGEFSTSFITIHQKSIFNLSTFPPLCKWWLLYTIPRNMTFFLKSLFGLATLSSSYLWLTIIFCAVTHWIYQELQNHISLLASYITVPQPSKPSTQLSADDCYPWCSWMTQYCIKDVCISGSSSKAAYWGWWNMHPCHLHNMHVGGKTWKLKLFNF